MSQLHLVGQQQLLYKEVSFAELLQHIQLEDDTMRVFNFWATWCKPCIAEMPFFEQVAQQQRDEAFQLYFVSLDFLELAESKLQPFIIKHNLKSKVWLFYESNPNDWISLIEPLWSGAIPMTIVTHKGKRFFAENTFDSTQHLHEFLTHCKNAQP